MPPPTFAIYSDDALRSRLRLRRWQVIGLFAAGLLAGVGLSQSGGWPPAAYAQPQVGGCDDINAARSTLQLSCSFHPR